MAEALRAHGLGHVLDIVPNHMVRDRQPVLGGRAAARAASRHAAWFDVDC
jgi:maltooligosyltrehalose synthase